MVIFLDDRHDDSSSSEQQFHVFKDFDFLDIEYDTEVGKIVYLIEFLSSSD